jgi:hypothetical protein
MLGFSCGYSTTYRRNTMPVQQIELEEVNVVDITDKEVEASCNNTVLRATYLFPPANIC